MAMVDSEGVSVSVSLIYKHDTILPLTLSITFLTTRIEMTLKII